MSRRICIVTGTRAEYGLLRGVMQEIQCDRTLELQLIATGMHLSPKFGNTDQDIERDGFEIARKVDMHLDDDSPVGIARSIGAGIAGFGEALKELQPDCVVVLGDRFEILAAVSAALVARFPVAHIHGGELTEGAFDDAIRHAVTKMSHLHFVAAEEYRRRVIQLGEDPERVFCVGGLGVDAIKRLDLLDRKALEASLDFKLGKRNLLVTFHPATLDGAAEEQCAELLAALESLNDIQLIFTFPNADTGGRAIRTMIESFVEGRSNARAYASLGQKRYLSCMHEVDGVVGNSSSGILEAPAFKVGTVNIGNRQQGRLRAESVIDCAPERNAITAAIEKLYSAAFQDRLAGVQSAYGDGGASTRIVQHLRKAPLDGILKKSFHDLAWIEQEK